MLRLDHERRDTLLALGAYTALTVVAFWPLVKGLSSVAIPTGDVFGNIWALHWVSRHLLVPSRLFAANIYYPEPQSLASTESLLAQSFVAAPLLAWGASPVAAYNVVWLLTYPLSGLGAYLLARHLSGSGMGAFLAGLAFAFSSYRIESSVHIQTLSIQWLPFAILFLLRSLASPTLANLCGCGVFVLLQALSSGYYAALLAPVVAVTILVHVRSTPVRTLVRVLAALALTALIAAPAFIPYLQAQEAHGLARRRQELVSLSALWSSYLRPSGHLASPTLRPLRRLFHEGPAFYPGTAVLVLAIAGLALRRRPTGFLLALGATGLLLSLGPQVTLGPVSVSGPYDAIRSLPGYRLLRTPYRMAPIALLPVCLLASIGWASLDERFRWFRRWAPVFLALALCEGAAVRTSRLFGPMPQMPDATRWLTAAPQGPVLELPWSAYNGLYAYWSIFHRQPMVNGWGAFAPPASIRIGMIGVRWPGGWASHALRGAGIRYVVVHTDRLESRQRARLLETTQLPEGVTLAAQFREDRIYTLSPDGPTAPLPGNEEAR
jgi:hypothetical protein